MEWIPSARARATLSLDSSRRRARRLGPTRATTSIGSRARGRTIRASADAKCRRRSRMNACMHARAMGTNSICPKICANRVYTYGFVDIAHTHVMCAHVTLYTGFYTSPLRTLVPRETTRVHTKLNPKIRSGSAPIARRRHSTARRRSTRTMAKVPARLRAVTYSLSPMRTGVMHGLFKDWAAGMAKRVQENAVDVGLFCALPLGATVWCVRATRARADRSMCARYARGARASGRARVRARGRRWTSTGRGRGAGRRARFDSVYF